jgi:hypothetical protein
MVSKASFPRIWQCFLKTKQSLTSPRLDSNAIARGKLQRVIQSTLYFSNAEFKGRKVQLMHHFLDIAPGLCAETQIEKRRNLVPAI